MYKILSKTILGPNVKAYRIEAPLIAQAAKPGQFVIIRLHERGERIPLTIADWDPQAGTITLVVQEVGKTTKEMGERYGVGDCILNVVGPLGTPSEIRRYGTVICVAGGVGIAPIYPIARALKEAGNRVIGIAGARAKELFFWLDRLKEVTDELFVTTDDGSFGRKGVVTDPLRELLAEREVDHVWAIGPAVMMKFCSLVCQQNEVPITVSLNPIMVDGSGMCGACRVEVGGETKFACVDGPEFDGTKVNWDLLLARLSAFREEEKRSLERYLGRTKEGER
ncbi:MAG TPA: sulfide/dihydroorotate dehydrogenase-like FAD/NAD-binding protein [Candidatus Acetothermia bacterium]|nr:sulfide/dihydroorotate dehydrogenase-like FAD/NAD-binding protein [Candidatus Acetothermia bacterium]